MVCVEAPSAEQSSSTVVCVVTAYRGVRGSMQGLVYWRGSGHHMVVANRIAQSSPILPGEPLTYINSVAVAPNGKVYFTSSGHIPPPMHKGVYNTKMSSGYMALEVRIRILNILGTVCSLYVIQHHWCVKWM